MQLHAVLFGENQERAVIYHFHGLPRIESSLAKSTLDMAYCTEKRIAFWHFGPLVVHFYLCKALIQYTVPLHYILKL